MQPDVAAFFDEETFTVSYVVGDPATGRAAIIDSVLDFDHASGRTRHVSADKIVAHVESKGLKIDWVLETHVHADHLTAAPYLRERLGAPIGIGRHVSTVQRSFADLYGVDAASVKIHRVDTINAVKVSFPRRVPSGELADNDITGGQEYGPLVELLAQSPLADS